MYKKGYQEFDTAQSSATSKVKGVAFVNYTKDPNIGTRVWDPADYVVPPEVRQDLALYTDVPWINRICILYNTMLIDVSTNACWY